MRMVEVNAMKIDYNCRMNAPLYSRYDVIEDIMYKLDRLPFKYEWLRFYFRFFFLKNN